MRRSRRALILALPVFVAAIFALVWHLRRASLPNKTPSVSPAAQPSAAPPQAPAAPLSAWPTPFSVDLNSLPKANELPPGTLRILVLGDSVATFLGLAMRYRQDEEKTFVASRGVGSCSIFESKPYVENGKTLMSSSCSMHWAEDVAELHPDITLLVLGGAFLNEHSCEAPFQASYEARIVALSKAMGPSAGRIVLTRMPYPLKDWRHGKVLSQADCWNDMIARRAAKEGFPILDLMGYLCPTPACIAESQGKPVRPDGLHFDGAGAEETARWVLRELRKVADAHR